MKISGTIKKSGNWWAVKMPIAGIYTQGKTKKDALFMAQDAIECTIESMIDGSIKATAEFTGQYDFSLSTNNDAALVALILKNKRAESKLSIREVAAHLGSKNPNSYAQYERGKTRPSIDKFNQLLKAINPNLELVLTL